MTTGDKIRARREELGWTPEQLARESRMPLAWVESVEVGRTRPMRTTMPLALAAIALDVEADDLWHD